MPRWPAKEGVIVPPGDEELQVDEVSTADVSLVSRGAAPDPSDKKAYEAYVESLRVKRRPFGALSQKLALPQRSGYKRHWFNDVGGRVQEHLDTGWTHVLDPKGKPVKRTVGSGRDNKALVAYALEIPMVFWEESQQELFNAAKARMDDIKKAPIRAEAGTAKASDRDKFYSPREEIISVRESISKS